MPVHSSKEVLKYWDREDVESMYDKYLLSLEIASIKSRLSPNSKILDAGCGEGEGTLVYSGIPGVVVHAADFSTTRLRMAKRRLAGRTNVTLYQVDFLGEYSLLDHDYDFIVSQRFLINLMKWSLQKRVLLDFSKMLKVGGRILMLEGSLKGVNSLNDFRDTLGLKPIPVRWHNLFFDDYALIRFMTLNGFKLVDGDGFGEYFLLTRGIRPYFDRELSWKSDFNRIAASQKVKKLLSLGPELSRLKLWVFEKKE